MCKLSHELITLALIQEFDSRLDSIDKIRVFVSYLIWVKFCSPFPSVVVLCV